MEAGKYDAAVGLFSHTKYRIAKIHYTEPVIIDANAVLHFKQNDTYDHMFAVLKKTKVFVFIFLAIILFMVVIFLIQSIDISKRKFDSGSFSRNLVKSFMIMAGCWRHGKNHFLSSLKSQMTYRKNFNYNGFSFYWIFFYEVHTGRIYSCYCSKK